MIINFDVDLPVELNAHLETREPDETYLGGKYAFFYTSSEDSRAFPSIPELGYAMGVVVDRETGFSMLIENDIALDPYRLLGDAKYKGCDW